MDATYFLCRPPKRPRGGLTKQCQRYSTAKRPSSQKPFAVAISVTVAAPGAVSMSARAQMHPAEPEVPDRPYPQMLHATDPERTLGRADGSADFRQVQRPVVVGLQHFLKPRHNCSVANYSPAHIIRLHSRRDS